MNKEKLNARTKLFAHRCVKLAMSLPAKEFTSIFIASRKTATNNK